MNGTINKVILIGNLGDDVKMHHFEGGNSIGRFPIATTEAYTSRTGERVTETEWHNLVTRNKLAELCDRYLKKGDKVFVEGRIKTRKWDDNGTTRYSTEIIVGSIEFLTPKGESSTMTEQNTNPSSTDYSEDPSEETKGLEDDLPF